MTEDYASRMSDLVLRLYELCQERQVHFAARYGLRVAEFRCLRTLWKGGSSSIRHLAELMNLSPARLTRIVEDLRKKGLVERHEPEDDRRFKIVNLTPQGRELAEEMTHEYDEMHRQILALLQNPSLGTVVDTFEDLIRAMELWSDEHMAGHSDKQTNETS
ncbi:MAG: winged helix-turn-helix transcriptional regulator [Calditrichaeota bacterium]|nr:winged helix-turn-helix transcriptional regulator [Calditrichota bacterium]